ncbi:uncharacterized protein cd27 isoform X2 [Conger conger]|uniref:uncharacterized protein cd27 isoform X2 n=1 Tax=Conger conger TaxID=82655 RepID=UPI002A5AF75D|nr:uncharacterized protein cd27 isoform X2 [Conger conger]
MKMMQSMSGVLLTLFLSFHFLLCHSQNCDRNTQYERDGRMCCMCKPGERLKKHCTASSPTSCERCEQGFYSKQYDTEFTCRKCHDCSMIHLKYTRHCSGTDNAVCECKPGYRCKAQPCLSCEEIPTLVVEKNTTIREAPRHSSEGGVTPSNPHKEETNMCYDGSGEQLRGTGSQMRQQHRISARKRRGKFPFRKCVKSWRCRRTCIHDGQTQMAGGHFNMTKNKWQLVEYIEGIKIQTEIKMYRHRYRKWERRKEGSKEQK